MLRWLRDALFPRPEGPEQGRSSAGEDQTPQSKVTAFADLPPQRSGPIELVSPACPYCGAVQDPPPQRRKKCRDCGEVIHTRTDHVERKRYLATAAQYAESERARRDQEWKDLSQTIQKAMLEGDWGSLQGAYQQQARILFNEGRPHRHISIEARRAALIRFGESGVHSAKVQSAQDERVCDYCASLDGKFYSVEDALEQMPIPGPHCTDGGDENPHGGRCRCVYIPVIPEANDD